MSSQEYTITDEQIDRLEEKLVSLDEITSENTELVWGCLNILEEVEQG